MVVIYEEELSVILRDLTLLTIVPVVLIGIHFHLTSRIRTEFAFQYPNFEVETLLTSAYVHGSITHLIHNLVGYICAVSIAYFLSLSIGKRAWYWKTFPILLIVLPILTTLGNYLYFSAVFPSRLIVVRGFSGIVASIIGFTVVVFFQFVHRNYGILVTRYLTQLSLLVILAELFLLSPGPIPLVGIGSLCLGVVLIGAEIAVENPSFDTNYRYLQQWLHGLVTAVVFLFLMIFTYQLLRSQTTGNVHTHVFGHVLGLIGGVVCAGICLLVQFRGGSISKN